MRSQAPCAPRRLRSSRTGRCARIVAQAAATDYRTKPASEVGMQKHEAWGMGCVTWLLRHPASLAGRATHRPTPPRPSTQVRVMVAGPTGYIGKFVTNELVKRGYNVLAVSRENAGIKGKLGKADIEKVGAPGQPSLPPVRKWRISPVPVRK